MFHNRQRLRQLFVHAILITVLAGSFVGIISQTKQAFASSLSGVAWPVKGSDGTWYKEFGYNINDHGNTNFGQLFGFDLVLNMLSSDTHGKDVISPVAGKIVYNASPTSTSPGHSIGIAVNNAPGLRVSLVHVDPLSSVSVGMLVSIGTVIGTITDQPANAHLHFNLFRLTDINDENSGRIPVPFINDTTSTYGGFDTHIIGCQDFAPDGTLNGTSYNGSQNQYGSQTVPINCGITSYGYWMGPTPTGTDAGPIHLYGNPPARNIQLGYHSNDTNGKTVDYVDFWSYQNSQWNWLGRQNPDANKQEFTNFSLQGAGYIAVDVHTTDGNWHEAENGIRVLCVLLSNGSKQCPNLTSVTYHDGSLRSPGVGGGGDPENPNSPAPGPSCSSGGDGVTLFVDASYGNTCHTFGVGEYSDLTQFGLGQNVSSLLDTNAGYHITLFDQKGLTGTPAYYDSNTPQLTGYWNDRALSMRVEQHSSNGVTLFTDASYGGTNHTFGVGEYSDLSQFGLDQNVSSLKDTNGAYHITFYDQKGLTGTPAYYDADTGQLTGYWNDRARSMRVELHSTDGVTPFVDANYGGANHTFGVGEYSDLSQFGLDQNVSSLKDTNGAYHITFYDQKGLTGTPAYYDADTSQLTGYWNDRARSMRIEKHRPTTCDPGTDGIIAYIDANYQAGCLFITGDIPDLTSYNFEQVISSIRFAGTYTNSMQLAFYRQANYQDLCGTYSQDQADLQSCSDQAVSVKVLPFTPPTPTPGPTPTPVPPTPTATPSNSVELLTSPWHLTGNNGAAEADKGINSNALAGMTSVQVTFDLHGTTFCVGHPCGDDEASLVFVQNGDWRAAVVTTYGNNGQNGSQTVTIPLTDFHKVGDAATRLDPTQPVSNLHARFWNNNAFTVDITSVKLLSAAPTTTPTPTPVPPTPTPVPSATPTPHAPAPFTVYDETLAANWGDWSWCSTNNLSDTSHPNTGSHDLSWATTCAYGGLSLRLPAGFDTTNYSSLTFALQSSQANQTIQISLYDSAGNTGLPVQLTSYGGTPVAGKYTVYTIPLSAFQSTSTITGILIQDITNNASEPPMYIDTLAFK